MALTFFLLCPCSVPARHFPYIVTLKWDSNSTVSRINNIYWRRKVLAPITQLVSGGLRDSEQPLLLNPGGVGGWEVGTPFGGLFGEF